MAFAYLSVGLVCFLSLICRSSLHILDTNTLMVIYITNFWQFLSFFTLSMVYYRSDCVVRFINIFLISLCFYITCKKSRPDITKIPFSHLSSLYFIILLFKFRLLVKLNNGEASTVFYSRTIDHDCPSEPELY